MAKVIRAKMAKVIRAFCCHQKLVPKGLSAHAPGLYTYIISLTMCIKSDLFKLATKGQGDQSDKGSLLPSKFVPKRLSALATGLYIYIYIYIYI